jgi:hypothetical protein
MKIKIIIFTVLVTFCVPSFGQDMIAMFKGDNGYWGYININGKVIIEPKYNNCKSFHNGLAKVGANKFINSKGEELNVSHTIKDAREYSNGLVAIKVKNKWGYMDTVGEMVIPPIYKRITDFDNGFAGVSNKIGFFIIDKTGNEQEIKTKDGYITEKGKLEKIKKFHEGIAVIEASERFGSEIVLKYGFLNKNLEVIVEPKFMAVGHFHEGMAWVRTFDKKLGFVNKNGKVVVNPKYLSVGNYSGGMAWVRTNEGIGYIDKKGELIINPKFLITGDFDPKSGIARVKDNDGWAYINKEGKYIRLENIIGFKHFKNGFCLVKNQNGWGYIDAKGNWIIEPSYDDATEFLFGYARAKIKGKWGIINKKGEWVIEPTYKNIRAFSK